MIHPTETQTQPGLEAFLQLRLKQLNNLEGFILVEPGDTVSALEDAIQWPILYGDYAPSFEWVEDHGTFYEMAFLTDDSHDILLIPKQAGIDPDLLKLCKTHAL